MKIALMQLNYTVGDIRGNAYKIILAYQRAVALGADVAVCSELCLFGYPPKDLLLSPTYLKLQNKCLQKICREVKKTALIIGIAEENTGAGQPLFNSAIFIRDGKIVATHRKRLLPNYDVFDESRYFCPGNLPIPILTVAKEKIGLLICEDIWSRAETVKDHSRYASDPIDEIAQTEVPDVLITINASPYYWGKGDIRFRLVKNIAQRLHCAVIYLNQTGANDELIFDGQSFALNARVRCLGAAKAFAEDLVIVDTKNQTAVSYPASDHQIGDLYQALVLGVRDYLNKINCPNGVVVALSGGIDSALTACIAADALGSEKVLGISLPSEFSSDGSKTDARALARNLGIRLETVPINLLYDCFGRAVDPVIGWNQPGKITKDTTEENIQARLRGMIAMAVSNRTGKIVLSTGNKSEISVGYCTLYGDMVGGLAVISDVPKTLVYLLANYVNRQREIIPLSTITKPPSAELRPGQKDSDSLPPYEVLDRVLDFYLIKRMEAEEIIKNLKNNAAVIGLVGEGNLPSVVRRVIDLVNKNEFKRRQMAPGLKVTPLAFGSGRRLPIAAIFLS